MIQTLQHSLRTAGLHGRRNFCAFALPIAIGALTVGVQGGALADIGGGTLSTVTSASGGVLSTINAVLRPLSLIALVICGLAGAFSRMEWGTVAKVVIGILIANSATTILDWVGGGAAQT